MAEIDSELVTKDNNFQPLNQTVPDAAPAKEKTPISAPASQTDFSAAYDDESAAILTEKDYRGAVRILEESKKPSRVLRFIMNRLESYRQKRKMGWSRPQNKYGLRVFSSFYLFRNEDDLLLRSLKNLLLIELGSLTSYNKFLGDIFECDNLMGFVFCHDFSEGDKKFEGFTLSLGRKSQVSKRHRDRLDIIFESEIKSGRSTGLSRVRFYVDPFLEPIQSNPGEYFEISGKTKLSPYQDLFTSALSLINSWAVPTKMAHRNWEHWTNQYIDYFGPRETVVSHSMFRRDLYDQQS